MLEVKTEDMDVYSIGIYITFGEFAICKESSGTLLFFTADVELTTSRLNQDRGQEPSLFVPFFVSNRGSLAKKILCIRIV
jgi:hypothetical protein